MKLTILSYMAWGAGVTVLLALAVIALSSVLGMGLALTRLYAWPPLRALAAGYALVTRGIPLLVLLIGCYFSLPYLGLALPVYAAAIVVMGFYFAAYMGEVFRGAIMAVPRTQWDAGREIGERTGDLMSTYVGVAAGYYLICFPLARLAGYVERRSHA